MSEICLRLVYRYLIARDSASGDPLGFSHFRYDMDCDDEVLYVYEIQLEGKVRRKGLGRFMMQVRRRRVAISFGLTIVTSCSLFFCTVNFASPCFRADLCEQMLASRAGNLVEIWPFG